MKMKNRQFQVRSVWWGVKLHQSDAVPMPDVKSRKQGHVVFQIEGKERPLIILEEQSIKRGGKRQFRVLFCGTKNCDHQDNERNDLIPLSLEGKDSFVESWPAEISENLLTRYKAPLHEQVWRELKKKMCALHMQARKW